MHLTERIAGQMLVFVWGQAHKANKIEGEEEEEEGGKLNVASKWIVTWGSNILICIDI